MVATEKLSLTRLKAFCAMMFRSRSERESILRIPSARLFDEPGSDKTPKSELQRISLLPGISVAIDGIPAANASSRLIGSPSLSEGEM